MANIHPSSVVHPDAKIHESVEVGPFCLIGPDVKIGSNCKLKSHVVLEGDLSIGNGNVFHAGVVIGNGPQDIGYKDEPTKVQIGNNNIFREHCTVHKGTMKQDEITIIGDDCFLMVSTHVGHDCVVGNKVILVNNVLLGGHCYVGDGSVIGGNSALQQFSRVGKGCFIGGGSSIDKDIPSYSTAYGNRVQWRGLNLIGLKRKGFAREDISLGMKFFDELKKKEGTFEKFLNNSKNMDKFSGNEIIKQIVGDIRSSKNGIAAIKVS